MSTAQTNSFHPQSVSPESIELLKRRFRLNDLKHPVISTLYNYALARIAANPLDEFRVANALNANPASTIEIVDPVDIVQMEINLPSIPTAFAELQSIVKENDISAREVSKIVSRDLGLTAWLLKLVNSPFYGFSEKIDTIPRAVALLGVKKIKEISLSGVLQNLMARIKPNVLNMNGFWTHSLSTAIAAQEIGKLLGRPDHERLFVSGLLHDCGVLALAYAAPSVSVQVQHIITNGGKARNTLEQLYLNFDHARLGGMLLHRWNMPLSLVMSTLRHHVVEAPERYVDASIVHVADFISFSITMSIFDEVLPVFDTEAWALLGLSPEQLLFIADLTMSKTIEVSRHLK